jgi:hypothetical protein
MCNVVAEETVGSATELRLLVSQGLGFDCNQMVGKLVVYIFRDI